MTKILCTGGAGFLGAHLVNLARKRDYQIMVVDNYSQGMKNVLIDDNVEYQEVDIRDKNELLRVFREFKPDVVHHFAAIANVAPAFKDPAYYYDVNITGSLNVLDCMRQVGCSKIVFMSTAAVYAPQSEPLTEDSPKFYGNPYAHSKLVIEQVLKDYFNAYGFSSVTFRPFCATGVDENLEVGCYHDPETQLVPNIIKTLTGKQKMFNVYGTTHDTPDGTAIRDYVHANDIAEAHLLAIKKLENPICEVYNLGMNKGCSIMEMITKAQVITDLKLRYEVKPMRPGDPAKLVGNSDKAYIELGWKPTRTIEDIIKSDFEFFKL